MDKYETSSDQYFKISDQDEVTLLKSLQLLQKISRRISHFLNDHRLFKIFQFDNKDHQQTLLQHAVELSEFLLKHNK